MLRLRTAWIVPIALTLIGFGSSVESVRAQSTTNFDIKYNTLFTLVPRDDLGQGIFRATITGSSSDAAFGLTNFESNTYGKLMEATATTQTFKFNTDPSTFGLQGQPVLGDRYFSSGGGSNELFGKASDGATINLAAGTVAGGGTITLGGGTGIFENPSGKITFTQKDKLGPANEPVKGEAILEFSVTTPRSIPEPTATTSLLGIGVTGAVLMLNKHRRKITVSL